MHIDRDRFMEAGYLILPQVVPPDQLQEMRRHIEAMVQGRQELSRQLRTPDQPAGGAWEESGQPRLNMQQDCDAHSAPAVEFLLGETTLGVARQLIDAPEIAVHNMNVLCSAQSRDTGPAAWHRDIGPGDPAPLSGMIANMQHHGPSYLQWNIALYDDDVLWIVPQSHRRLNTEEENRQLAANPRVPLPGGMPVELGAGDGVVYTHLLLHWGSNYTTSMRRALHPGYRPFGFAALPNVHWRHWTPGFFHHLSPSGRRQFEAWDQLFLADWDLIAALFHACIDRDAGAFAAHFDRLHPSPHDRLVCLAMLNNIVGKLARLKKGAPAESLWGIGRDLAYAGGLFTDEQVEILVQRLAPLDNALKAPAPRDNPSFQRGHSAYEPNHMPANFQLADFTADWPDA